MKCHEIMKKDVEQARPDEAVAEAAKKMREHNLGFLPVCDEHGNVLGTLTDRDIAIHVVADGLPPTTKVGDVMSHDVLVFVRPEDDIAVAEQTMAHHHKSRLLCVDGKKIVGIISLSDIAHFETSERRTAQTLAELTDREVHR
jgi:CBS domain-containing protein